MGVGDFVAVIAMTVGIGLQIVSVAQLLSVNSLFLASYNRSVVIFLVGLVLVSLGVATAIFLPDHLGHQRTGRHP